MTDAALARTISYTNGSVRNCVYCGAATRKPLACPAHSDLLRLDPTYLVRMYLAAAR